MKATAYINGNIISWALERAGKVAGDLARAMHVKPEVLADWVSGQEHPTFRQAQLLARKLYIPFGYLFLSDPPEERPSIPDLRTVRSERKDVLSLEFRDTLNDALVKQNWYKELLLKEGAPVLEFVGNFTMKDPVAVVAGDIRDTIGLDHGFRLESPGFETFLTRLIERVEAAGILVLRSGVVGNNNQRKLAVEEFRGFVLSDPVAPIVFINSNDALAGQIFTLAHELAHIWLGASGVTNPGLGSFSNTSVPEIESFCNKVAAEVLVPAAEFSTQWDEGAKLEENLNRISRYFRVSPLVALISAKTLQKIPNDVFLEEYAKRNVPRKKSDAASGHFHNTLPVRNSKTFTRRVLNAAYEGDILFRDAARLLKVKVKTLDALSAHLEIK